MSRVLRPAVLAAAALLTGLAATAPARAEFFGCNEPHTKVSYSSSSSRQAYRYVRSSHEYSAQARRVSHARVTYSSASRYYDSHYR